VRIRRRNLARRFRSRIDAALMNDAPEKPENIFSRIWDNLLTFQWTKLCALFTI